LVGRTREERDKIDGDQSFVPVNGWTQDRCTSSVPVGGSNRDKRCMSRLEPPTGIKRGSFCPGWCLQPGQNASVPSIGPASRWTRDKSYLLSRAQMQPGQMVWNKDMFCSSDFYPFFFLFVFLLILYMRQFLNYFLLINFSFIFLS
jgi:hypothetical protein